MPPSSSSPELEAVGSTETWVVTDRSVQCGNTGDALDLRHCEVFKSEYNFMCNTV